MLCGDVVLAAFRYFEFLKATGGVPKGSKARLWGVDSQSHTEVFFSKWSFIRIRKFGYGNQFYSNHEWRCHRGAKVVICASGGGMCAAPEWRLDEWTRSPMWCIGNNPDRRLICICRILRGGLCVSSLADVNQVGAKRTRESLQQDSCQGPPVIHSFSRPDWCSVQVWFHRKGSRCDGL